MACVLVIDDDPHVRDLVQDALGQAGHTVVLSRDGREGLRACTNPKTTVLDRLPIHASASFYPIRPATYPLLEGAASLIYGSGLRTRLSGLAQVARSLRSLIASNLEQ